MHAKKWLAVVTILVLAVFIVGCGKKSGLEGKLVDGKGQPLPGVTIIAKQLMPIKGYDQFETITGSDGTFKFTKLFPSSKYEVRPSSDKWTTETNLQVESGPQGETIMLPSPMVIERALAKDSGTLMDPFTGKTRFSVSKEGVITDSKTGLEWILLPGDSDYYGAVAKVKGCTIAGGGWRIPGLNEPRTLYIKGFGQYNHDPLFKSMISTWTEPKDSKGYNRVYFFDLDFNSEEFPTFRTNLLGVRSPQRR